MDFFSNQDAARRKTGLLVFYFFIAVLLIIGAVYFAAEGLMVGGFMAAEQKMPKSLQGLSLIRFYWIGGTTAAVILLGSLFKVLELNGGGKSVAEMLGGKLIPTNSSKNDERRVLNVVEEMALASGVPVPPVYLMPEEQAINAFAAGYNADDAVVGVTRGTLEKLSRDELQGVIAHEFSHILNGDMRMNIKLIGVLHGILAISMVGYWLFRSMAHGSRYRSRNDRDSGGIAIVMIVFGLVLMALGYIGVFFGKLIKSAVSRQREFLADASAVQFTRNPDGIASALKKIGGFKAGSRIQHRYAEEASHMFFGNALRSSWVGLLSTHPPLETRIQKLDPGFDGDFSKLSMKRERPEQASEKAGKKRHSAFPNILPLPGGLDGGILHAVAEKPEHVLNMVGEPLVKHVGMARELIDKLPPAILEAAREPFGARAVIYLLLLDREAELRGNQLVKLKIHADKPVYKLTLKLLELQKDVGPEARLPLVDLSLPALRELSPAQYETFRKNVDILSDADQEISLFEYALKHIIIRHLDAAFHTPRRVITQIYGLTGVEKECSIILSMLARVGHDHEAHARAAFDAAISRLKSKKACFTFIDSSDYGLKQVHDALNRLALVSFPIKKGILVACVQSVAFDSHITVEEAELFRTIADALECPVPPWLSQATAA